MKIGKYNEYQEMLLIECEQGMEVGGRKTVEELYAGGYKDVCEVEAPSETAVCTYEDYGTCFVQVWRENDSSSNWQEVDESEGEEVDNAEALNIITGKE